MKMPCKYWTSFTLVSHWSGGREYVYANICFGSKVHTPYIGSLVHENHITNIKLEATQKIKKLKSR